MEAAKKQRTVVAKDSTAYKVRYWRSKKMLPQTDVADRAGINHNTLSRIERGLQEPGVSTLGKIARALGVDPDELLS